MKAIYCVLLYSHQLRTPLYIRPLNLVRNILLAYHHVGDPLLLEVPLLYRSGWDSINGG